MIASQVKDTNIINDFFAIQPPKSFATLQEQLEFALSTDEDIEITDVDRQLQLTLPEGVKELLGIDGEPPIPTMYLTKPKRRDTSLGGNDAVNCYPQAHEDDDLVHPIHALDAYGNKGLGRVYEEKIDRYQQILWMTFGLPSFCDLSTFFLTSIDHQLAHLMNTGDDWSAWNIGHIVGKVVGFIATLPLKPFIFMSNLITRTFSDQPPGTRYIDFKPTMPLYYRIVNTQIAILAVNMQMSKPEQYFEDLDDQVKDEIFSLDRYKDSYEKLKEFKDSLDTESMETENLNIENSQYTTTPVSDDVNHIDDDGYISGAEDNSVSHIETNGLPEIFSTYGLDIVRMLAKKDMYDQLDGKLDNIHSLNKFLEELKRYGSGERSFWKDVVSGFMSGTYESLAFIGFRIEKSTNSSESVSNSVSMPEISNTVNSKIQSVRSMKTNYANFNLIGGKAGEVLGGIADAIKGFTTGLLDSINVSGIASLITGEGLVDFQEIWQNSNFSKSYNFTVKLRAVSGTKLAIMYKNIILMMLLAGALPRATGRSTYTSPFLVRAYCPGKFAVPIGIIDSMSITRGSDEFGWSIDGLPLNIDVSFTIKDLSPCMFLGMADSASWLDILGQNTSFSEYLMTISGVSVQDRLLKWRQVKRRVEILMKISRTVKFNPMLWGLRLSNNTFVGRLACALSPVSKLPS